MLLYVCVSTKNYSNYFIRGTYIEKYTNSLCYCPHCLDEELGGLGIKIEHQLPDVYICHKHGCYLNRIHLDSIPNLECINEWPKDIVPYIEEDNIYLQIAEDVAYIIENPPKIDFNTLQELILLEWVSLYNKEGKFIEKKLRDKPWMEFYNKLPSHFEKYKKEGCFEKFTGRKSCGRPHPLEYLLFIRSVCGSFENFITKYKNK